jgi:cytochrome c553
MPYFLDDTRHWKERAREARAMADRLTDPVAKQAMEEIAAAYERMAARRAEEAAKDAS